MSTKDPKSSQTPTSKAPPETLEDAIYKPTLSGNNSAMKGTNPLIAVPLTIVTYTCVALLIFFVATRTEMGRKVIEETKKFILEEEQEEKIEDHEPPPPPPPAQAAAPPLKVEVKEQPPPPPLTNQEQVPEDAPPEMPKKDLIAAYAVPESQTSSVGNVGTAPPGTFTGTGDTGPQTTSATTVHEFSFNQLAVTFQPGQPPYPPLARAAKAKGAVTVELVIGTDGVPVSAKAISGHNLLLEHSANWAMKWRFKPALMDGHPVQARFRITMNWKI